MRPPVEKVGATKVQNFVSRLPLAYEKVYFAAPPPAKAIAHSSPFRVVARSPFVCALMGLIIFTTTSFLIGRLASLGSDSLQTGSTTVSGVNGHGLQRSSPAPPDPPSSPRAPPAAPPSPPQTPPSPFNPEPPLAPTPPGSPPSPPGNPQSPPYTPLHVLLCEDTCVLRVGSFGAYAVMHHDGICQDGGVGAVDDACPLGTDCTDCGGGSRTLYIKPFQPPAPLVPPQNPAPPPPSPRNPPHPSPQTPPLPPVSPPMQSPPPSPPLTPPPSPPPPHPPPSPPPPFGPGYTQLLCEESCNVPTRVGTLSYSSDGVCDDGGPGSTHSICELGKDCSDCGMRAIVTSPSPPPPSTPLDSRGRVIEFSYAISSPLALGATPYLPPEPPLAPPSPPPALPFVAPPHAEVCNRKDCTAQVWNSQTSQGQMTCGALVIHTKTTNLYGQGQTWENACQYVASARTECAPCGSPAWSMCEQVGCNESVWNTATSHGGGTCGEQIRRVKTKNIQGQGSTWVGACGFVSRNLLNPQCSPCGNARQSRRLFDTDTLVVNGASINDSEIYDNKVNLSSCVSGTADFVNARLAEARMKQVFAQNYHCGLEGSVLYVNVPSSNSTLDDVMIISMLNNSMRRFLESSLQRTLKQLWTRVIEQ